MRTVARAVATLLVMAVAWAMAVAAGVWFWIVLDRLAALGR